MKKNHSNLDEMQEQKLLHIEHNGCWFAFWALLAAIVIQLFVFDHIEQVVGEWVVFMCLALYLCVDCMRKGIWDKKLKPSPLTNLLLSILAGFVTGIIFFGITYYHYQYLMGSVFTGVFTGLLTFALCFSALLICSWLYKKRLASLETENTDEL